MQNTSTICLLVLFEKNVSCGVFIGLGAVLLLSCLILIGVTCTLCHRLKRLKKSKEGSYKRSKTCKHYRLSMRELQEQEDAWDEENGFTNFEPMITIGSAFDSPHHGPTPPPLPPPPKEVIHTDCKTEETDGLKRLPRSKEKSYKTSKTSKRYKLSVRELYERKEAWNEDDSVTSCEPVMTIGSAFGTPYHGPTPTSPPPPTDDLITHTGYCREESDGPKDHGQTPNLAAETRFKKKIPLKPPQYKTLPSALERRCLEELDDALNNTASVGPLCRTLDYRLDQSDRQEHPSLTDAWYNQPDEWNRHPDDCRPYYMGKLSDQNINKEDIQGNDVFDVNEILENANAIEVVQETTLTENMYENLVSLREGKKSQNLNPAFRQSIQSYIDMTASPDGEEYVQMKITLTKSAASEICRKARLCGMSCTSEVFNGSVMDKPTNTSVDC
ncbi:hypothetical protein CHS0354_039905 [Potamilus streckersoni]|uniref:Uncharacterized protein n=1 Tax=Potamilus streckersoni TaxID=2493646 RepID=A0AAE0WE76_9BIVA|nr:hypothetical protein CHS0354_039905 [Potamilus streckersoni]